MSKYDRFVKAANRQLELPMNLPPANRVPPVRAEPVRGAFKADLLDVLTKRHGQPTAHPSGQPFDAVNEKTVAEMTPRLRRAWQATKGAVTGPVAKKLMMYGAGATGIALALKGLDRTNDKVSATAGKKKAYNAMVAQNKWLEKEDPEKVKQVFNTLHTFNRDMAHDPLVAGSFLRRAMQFKEEGIQPVDVKTLTEIGKNLKDSRKGDSLLGSVFGDTATVTGLSKMGG